MIIGRSFSNFFKMLNFIFFSLCVSLFSVESYGDDFDVRKIIYSIKSFEEDYVKCVGEKKFPFNIIYFSKNFSNKRVILSLDISHSPNSKNILKEDCIKTKRSVKRKILKIDQLDNYVDIFSYVKYRSLNYQITFDEIIKFSPKKDRILEVRRFVHHQSGSLSGKFVLLEETDYNNLIRDVDRYGALNRDVIFAKMSAKSASQILTSYDTSDIFVAVFIPNFFVKPGSIITIEHLYRRTGEARRWWSYGQDFKVNKVQPYIFAATTAWASFPDGGTVEMTAYVDGYGIHTQIFKLVRY